MDTCDHYNYVKTKAYMGSLKVCLQTYACDPCDLYGDQDLSSGPVLQMPNKDDFKDFEAMTKEQTFHPVNASLSRVNKKLF